MPPITIHGQTPSKAAERVVARFRRDGGKIGPLADYELAVMVDNEFETALTKRALDECFQWLYVQRLRGGPKKRLLLATIQELLNTWTYGDEKPVKDRVSDDTQRFLPSDTTFIP